MKTLLISSLIALLMPSLAAAQANPCESDVDGDGVVAGADLSIVLASWGGCSRCIADINGDSLVDGIDLSFVLSRWGGLCAPTATSLSAAAGPLAGGVPVTVQGDHLLNPTGVTFGGSPASVVASTRTSVTVVAPAHPEGTATVVINTQGGTVVAGSFAYYGAPTITAVTPNAGYAGGGQTVMVTGSGFYGAPSVRFGKSPASSVTILSPTQLRAVTPPGDVGTMASLTVSTPSGVTTVPGAFTYISINVPAWATMLEATPDPSVIWDPMLREAITATGYAWRVRDVGSGIEMVLIPPGTFNMGCSASDQFACNVNESPVHRVTLTNAFYLGRYEVTQGEWQAKIGANPSTYPGQSRPVETVSWITIQDFLIAADMRLPTEAEWEYAYRASTETAFHGLTGYLEGTNDDALVEKIAWYLPPVNGTTHPVGLKAANGFGLHDMAGNVWEWVNDWYSMTYYASSPSTNPPGPTTGSSRVMRGGGWWDYNTMTMRASWRAGTLTPDSTRDFIGFRVARNP